MSNTAVLEELRMYAILPEEIFLIEKHNNDVDVFCRKDGLGNRHFFILIKKNDQQVFKSLLVDLLTQANSRYKPVRKPCYWVKQGGDRNNLSHRIYAALSLYRYPGSIHFFMEPDDFEAVRHSSSEVAGRFHGE